MPGIWRRKWFDFTRIESLCARALACLLIGSQAVNLSAYAASVNTWQRGATEVADSGQPASDAGLQSDDSALASGVVFSPAEAIFGDVGVGTTSSSITVTIHNDSTSAVHYLSSSGLKEFKLQSAKCPLPGNRKTLEAGASCTFEAAFAPTASGASTGETHFKQR